MPMPMHMVYKVGPPRQRCIIMQYTRTFVFKKECFFVLMNRTKSVYDTRRQKKNVYVPCCMLFVDAEDAFH